MDGVLTTAILIVSTTAAQDPSTDAAASVLRDVLEIDGGGKWAILDKKIVPDNLIDIQRQVTRWTDSVDAPNLVITTGGTGFAVSDVTPEAIALILNKQAPGLVHAMLSASLVITPFAMMSRPAAGVRNKSVVITLPGSPKAAEENLRAVIKTLPHACLQAAGAESRQMHAGGTRKLEEEAGIDSSIRAPAHSVPHAHGHAHDCPSSKHNHGHGNLVRHTTPNFKALSNDPSLGPTHRHRESPYPMVSVHDALSMISEFTPEPEITQAKVDENITGLVLAQDVRAQENVPAFKASIVDGYAVVVPSGGDIKGVFPVTGVSHAAPAEIAPLQEGQVARITTGAPLPLGATSVIMVEDTILRNMTEDGKEEEAVEIQVEGVKDGENVRQIGSDVKQGATILNKGELISGVGGEIGLLASVGTAQVSVYRRPVVGILSTGDEIVQHNYAGPLKTGQVRDTNRITLMTAAREWGFRVVDLGIARDVSSSLEDTLRAGLRRVDLLITTGGVSMGELDLLKPTIERSLGGTIHFGRVAMKPGKPTTFATVPFKDNDGRRVSKTVFSLPGNPASALVTFHLFVLPSLHKLSGISPVGLPRIPVVLGEDFPLDSRPEYHRAVMTVQADGRFVVNSTGGQRSSRVGSLRSANALVCLPSGSGRLESGSKVDALLIDALRSL